MAVGSCDTTAAPAPQNKWDDALSLAFYSFPNPVSSKLSSPGRFFFFFGISLKYTVQYNFMELLVVNTDSGESQLT